MNENNYIKVLENPIELMPLYFIEYAKKIKIQFDYVSNITIASSK